MKNKTAVRARWNNLDLNQEEALVMHIDLNSAFATIEQQARPSLRGRPVGVTNRISKNCCVIAASYEAKALGIKVGMGLMEARSIAPDLMMLESDPPKYHHVYKKLCAIMKSYSPNVVMKSIDEGIIDFHDTRTFINKRPLEDIGMEIKQRVRAEIGNWMKINVGIGTNRFLAKTASNLHKPDGLDKIDHTNLRDVYRSLKLTDLTGIAKHYEARLNASGIFTPLGFLETSSEKLRRQVFHSIIGDDWYQRLRGYEVDDGKTKLGHIGRQFVLDKRTNDDSFILPRFQYLCETTGKKLRYNQVDARGILVWLVLDSRPRTVHLDAVQGSQEERMKRIYNTVNERQTLADTAMRQEPASATSSAGWQGQAMHSSNAEYWQARKMHKSSFYTDKEIYRRALYLFNQRPRVPVATIGITCYGFSPSSRAQASLFEEQNKEEWLTEAIDEINERYGIFAVHSLNSLEGKKIVRQKIPAFGGSKYFELLLEQI